MKNAILFRVNSLIAHITVNLTFGFTIAEYLLNLQTNINEYFDYDWSAAVNSAIEKKGN